MTLKTVVQNAAAEIGLEQPSTVVGNDDETASRLQRFAIRTGLELLRLHPWAILVKEHEITSTGATNYGVPSDWQRYIPHTAWNESDQWRIRGHEQPETWATRKNGWTISTHLSAAFRVYGNSGSRRIEFDPAPDSGDTVSLLYVSDQWIDTGSGLTDTWNNDGHTSLIPEDLIEMGVIWRTLRSLGRPYTDEKSDYIYYRQSCIAQDAPAPDIQLGSGEFVLPAVTPDTLNAP